MSERIDSQISNLGADMANWVIRRIAQHVINSGDPRSYWMGLHCCLAGAMAEHIGTRAAVEIQQEAVAITKSQAQPQELQS